jgi:hypothetical protein
MYYFNIHSIEYLAPLSVKNTKTTFTSRAMIFPNKYKKWFNRDVKGMNDSILGTPNEYRIYRKLF